MQQRQAGITALVTAYARAYHATHDSPLIFDDFMADKLYTPQERADFGHHLAASVAAVDPELAAAQPDEATALAAVMQLLHAPVTLSRSRYAEERLEASSAAQYVILGAGFDTFAFRRPEMLATMNVYEVDHPATQAMKRGRIAGWSIPARLHFVPVDFNTENFDAALLQAGFDPHQRTFFSWLGVTYYLSREAIFATLEAVRRIAAPGSEIVFDYMDADAFIPEKTVRRMQIMQGGARMVGEPMQTGFAPAALASDLEAVGFTLAENLAPADIQARYFAGRSDRYRAFEHVHFARAVV
jgi:methyltransferase (TIGR00027 family)